MSKLFKIARIGVILLGTMILMAGCGAKVVTYAPEDYIAVTVSGVNGEGIATVMRNDSGLAEKINKDFFKGTASEVELAQKSFVLYDSVEIQTMDSTEHLSNGDKINIMLSCNKEALERAGLAFEDRIYVYTVEGLEEPTVLDVLSDIAVTFSGTAPKGQAKVEYVGNDEIIKTSVYYSFDKSTGLSNGDTVTVTATYNEYYLDQKNCKIEETTKEFVVEGLTEYVSSAKDVNLDKFSDEMLAKANEIVEKEYPIDETLYSMELMKDGSIVEYWDIIGVDMTVDKAVLFVSPKIDDNQYVQFFTVSVTAKKRDKSKYVEGDGYETGAVETFSIPLNVYIGEITNDGVEIKYDYLNGKVLTKCLGMTYDEIIADYSTYNLNVYSSYTVEVLD